MRGNCYFGWVEINPNKLKPNNKREGKNEKENKNDKSKPKGRNPRK